MSLRIRILLLVLAATLLPAVAMGWLLVEQRHARLGEAHEQLVARVGNIAENLDDRISGTAQLLFGLSRVPILGTDDKAACSAFLADVLQEHPQYTGFLTIRPDGTLHCDSLRSGRKLNLTDRRYFQAATRSTGHVVEAAIGRLTGVSVLQIAYPVRDTEGTLRYVLLASLNLDQYAHTVLPTLPYPNTSLRIWNGDGNVIVQAPGAIAKGNGAPAVESAIRNFAVSGPSGKTAVLGTGRDARIWVAASLQRTPDAALRMTLDVPEADLHVEADRQLGHAVTVLAILEILFFIGAAAVAEFAIRRQAARIMSAISRMDAGGFDTPIGGPYPRGELGEVMSALDRMASSLDTQRREINRSHAALERQANFDSLTGLANRNMLNDRLAQALIYAHRSKRVVAVLVLDLDRFKTVNDSLGHSHGDVLLQEVARRLSGCVRQGDTVARLGGDEFVVVLTDMAELSDAIPVARNMLSAIALPLLVDGQEIACSSSIGICGYPDGGETSGTLLKNADTAMYRAKERGGNALEFFTPEMNVNAVRRLQIEGGLRRALEKGELLLHFQPIADMATGRITAAEALLRWQHPEHGMVPPAHFISIAEETGLIVPIGNWVLQQACAQIVAWREQGLDPVPIAVNLSARQFGDASLAASVAAAVSAAGCRPFDLQLEITESVIMDRPDRALATMHELNDLGTHLSVDDFGTGYSSLSYLKRFPVRKLKIDRSFVSDIDSDPNDEAIAGAIVALARRLGLRTVAEGVETAEQLQLLATLGCDEYQGYLLSRPCAPEEFAKLLAANRMQRRDGPGKRPALAVA